MPSHGIYRILVCRPNHRLGNMLLMTPLITELERRYRGAEIDIVAEGGAARDVFASFFSVRNIYCLPTRGFKHPLAFLRLLAQIRRNHYDLVIDPCLGSGFSRILTRLFRGKRKLGYGDPAHPRASPMWAGRSRTAPHGAAPGDPSCAGMSGRRRAPRATFLRWTSA
jgi:ADP-heptose:LPS heptosyltransferase